MFGSPHRFSTNKSWIKRHSLSLALLAVLLLQGVVTVITGYPEWLSEQQAHHQPVQFFDFVIWFIFEMTVSVIADTYGALLLVLFAKWFYEHGSPETPEEDEHE